MIRHNLSISNFKRKIRVILQIVGLLGVFFIGCKMMDYLYVAEDDWYRILWHNFYSQEKNIDCIYLGSSHVYKDLNPEILDERNRKNNFNMATSGQTLDNSYYVLKEAEQRNTIDEVYLEMYYRCSTGVTGDFQSKEALSRTWLNLDYMRFSLNKMKMLLNINPKKHYMDAFFPFIRYRKHLADSTWINKRVDYKQEENYKNYIYENENVRYLDKGYYESNIILKNPYYKMERMPNEIYMTEDAEYYLRKIIEHCQSEKIPIVLFSSPIYELEIISVGQYDNYRCDVQKIAEEYEVPYYDFNLVKEEYLPIQNPGLFMDIGHLNDNGAELFTNFFYEVVSSQPEDTEKYFYNSYEEKLASTEPEVFGIYYRDAEESELQEGEEPGKTYRMTIGSNRKDELEFQVYITPEGEDTVLLQDFSVNKEFNLPSDEHGVCKVIWRETGDTEDTHSLEVAY